MAEIKDIVDQRSLRVWLGKQSQNISVKIAFRAAMRVLPIYWRAMISIHQTEINHFEALRALRALIISEVVARSPEQDKLSKFKIAAASANAWAFNGAFKQKKIKDNVEGIISSALFSSANAAASANSTIHSARNSSAAVVSAVNAHDNGQWDFARKDCEIIMGGHGCEYFELWQGEDNSFIDIWSAIKTKLQSAGPSWQFWIEWYEASLRGNPLNLELLERIALIPPEIWEQGPAHVNAIIAEIEGEFEWKEPEDSDPVAANPLSQKDSMVLMTADGISAHIASVIERYHSDTGKNQLPEEFRILEELPSIFGRISQIALSDTADNNSLLGKEIAELKAKIEALEADLNIAKEKSVSGVFSEAFLEQAGKSLGDWKMWGALGSAAYFFASTSTSSGTVAGWSSISGIANSIREVFPHKP